MAEIKVGDRVQVPKGTIVYGGDNNREKSERTVTVTVAVIRPAWQRYRSLIPNQRLWGEVTKAVNLATGYSDEWNEPSSPVHPAALGAIHQFLDPYLYGKQPTLVEWSGGKFALLDDVVLKEGASSAAAKPVSKLQQMVPGSRWRVSQDTDLVVEIDHHASRGPGRTAQEQRLKAYVETQPVHGKRTHVTVGTVTAGTLLECTGKTQGMICLCGEWHYEARNTLLPFKVIEGTLDIKVPMGMFNVKKAGGGKYLPYKSLEPVTEVESIPQVKVFVLRDRETGQFFSGIDYDDGRNGKLGLTDRFTKAKKYDDIGKLKSSILDFNGYYDYSDMPYGHRPDWVGGRKVADLPQTWDAVSFDKLAKTELEVHDIQTWSARTWKLRGLTVQFGSSVRKLYNDLDKKGEVAEFAHVMTIYADPKHYDELTPAEIAAFDAAIKTVAEGSGLKRSDWRRAKETSSMAVSFRDPNGAFMMRMAYAGKSKIGVINMETLTEVTETAAA